MRFESVMELVKTWQNFKAMMTVEGAIRYANNMREEIKTLAFYADLYGKSCLKSLMLYKQSASCSATASSSPTESCITASR